jgi:aminopeptidase N
MLIMSSAIFAQTPPIEPGVSQELARWRAARYSDVRYKLSLTLEKRAPVLKGTIEIRVKLSEPPASAGGQNDGESTPPIILDWRRIKGHEEKSKISNVLVNGKAVSVSMNWPPADAGGSDKNVPPADAADFNEHLIFRDGVVAGENVIKLDFTSPILTSGSAITRYVDKEDGSEYIYSLFVPSDASTAFPVFDQPDLKARFELTTHVPLDREGHNWKVISNASIGSEPTVGRWGLPGGGTSNSRPWVFTRFAETEPISTYVFAFAAGPWEKVSVPGAVATGSNVQQKITTPSAEAAATPPKTGGERKENPVATGPGTDSRRRADKNTAARGNSTPREQSPLQRLLIETIAEPDIPDPYPPLSSNIYVRKSQAAKFKPHAAEVFRLNREAIKYFEQYFDYKFPFPKYDLVLIPEFPFGGMEHAGATFLRESSIIFPQEPTKNDLVSRATLIFHEAAHQWFGDTVTMRWFDDLWLKEGFATFTAYKAMEKIMPEMNAWKVFYERIKQGAYQTDSTRGTTAIYQPIANLSAAKSAYGNIVYNKAPAFLRQAEFYLGEDKFQTAVRAFLKKHEFGNAGWEDLVGEFGEVYWKDFLYSSSGRSLLTSNEERLKHEKLYKDYMQTWARVWVNQRGLPIVRVANCFRPVRNAYPQPTGQQCITFQEKRIQENRDLDQKHTVLIGFQDGSRNEQLVSPPADLFSLGVKTPDFIFLNNKDYGYGIFLLDEKSRDYVLKNIQNEKDPFLRAMMWGALWDSVREGELDPRVFVELVIKVLGASPRGITTPSAGQKATGIHPSLDKEGSQEDESTIATLLGRTGTALNYYLSEPPALAGGQKLGTGSTNIAASNGARRLGVGSTNWPPADAGGSDMRGRVEDMLIERMQNAPSLGQRITFYRAFLNIAASEKARGVFKTLLATGGNLSGSEGAARRSGASEGTLPTGRVSASIPLKTKDKFDIVTRLLILNDPDAPRLLAELEKTETSDDAKRYAYAAKAGIATAENKARYWKDFTENKEISESWIEAAFGPWNSIRHSELTLPYLERALRELPYHKRNRKIFFVNGWLGAFIGGQRSEEALAIVSKFLADNPGLDNDLRLKILENVDLIERAVRIRGKYSQNRLR